MNRKHVLIIVFLFVGCVTCLYLVSNSWTKISSRKSDTTLMVAMEPSVKPDKKEYLDNAEDSKNPREETVNLSPQSHIVTTDMPLDFIDDEITLSIAGFEISQVWRAQDKVIKTWPAFLEIKDKLSKELFAKLDIDELSDEELIQTALEFRKSFWQAGGCLSKISYRDAYMAIILLEYGHNRNPRNMPIIDELVETIQSTLPLYSYDRGAEERQRYHTNQKILLDLRSKQFAQIKKEVEHGRRSTWQDFICACDQAMLLKVWGNLKEAKKVVEWQLQQTEQGEWIAYSELLRQGNGIGFNIYVATKSTFPEEFRYGRRLPSFRGPTPVARGVALWGAHPELLMNAIKVETINGTPILTEFNK